jgi:shikimate kinase
VRGLGEARAAVSLVNALPLGIGAAVGIEWPVRVTARLERPPRTASRTAVDPPRSATPVVRAAASAARDRFGPGAAGRLRLVVRSTIPVGRGLKSSSAVSSAVALATSRAFGGEPSPEEIARLSAEVGRSTGVSATGAFDDALAGLVAGGVVTDNRTDTELRRLRLPADLGVALWVPGRRHPSAPSLQARFRKDLALSRRAADAVLAGDWITAMEANTRLVEKAMGYRYAGLREAVHRAGATAAGVTGLGPAFAALAPHRHLDRVLRALPATGVRRPLRLFAVRPPGREPRP